MLSWIIYKISGDFIFFNPNAKSQQSNLKLDKRNIKIRADFLYLLSYSNAHESSNICLTAVYQKMFENGKNVID